jgi:multiple antibiotic resistance protein
MLVGPGAISTALILLSQANGVQVIALFLSIVAVCFVSYWILWLAVRGAHYMSPLALKLTTRLMGLLLAAVAAQFVINAVEQLGWIKQAHP